MLLRDSTSARPFPAPFQNENLSLLIIFVVVTLTIKKYSAATPPSASAAPGGAAAVEDKVLCDAECEAFLKEAPLVELPSGLSYRDVRKGSGPEPPVGFQVVANYVAMTPNGKVFDSSLNRGAPYDFRIGAGQVKGYFFSKEFSLSSF